MPRTVILLLCLAACAPDGLPVDRLPVSTATLDPPEVEALLAADGTTVRLDGEAVGALGSTLDLDPVREALQARALALQQADPDFVGTVRVEVGRDLPAEVLMRLVHASVEAGFRQPSLGVADARGQPRAIRLSVPELAAADVDRAERTGDLVTGGYANPTVEVRPDQGFVLRASNRVFDQGEGLVLACDPAPCAENWPAAELNRVVRRLKLDHPRDRAVVVAAVPEAPVQAVVTALDATRHDAFTGRGEQDLLPEALLAMELP